MILKNDQFTEEEITLRKQLAYQWFKTVFVGMIFVFAIGILLV